MPIPEGPSGLHFDFTVPYPIDPIQWYLWLKNACGFVGQRYHAIVSCIASGTPFISIDTYGCSSVFVRAINKFGYYNAAKLFDQRSKIYNLLDCTDFEKNRFHSSLQHVPPEKVLSLIEEFSTYDVNKLQDELNIRYEANMENLIDALQKINNIISINKKRFTNISLFLLSSLLKSSALLLINPFLAKNLSHNDYAIIGYFGSFNALFMPLINFSFVQYYSKQYFRISEDRREQVRDTLISAQIVFGILELLILSVCFYTYFRILEVGFPFFPYAILSLLTTFFNTFLTFKLVDLKLKREAKQYLQLIFYNTSILLVLLLIFVIVLKLGAFGDMSAYLLAGILTGFYCISKTISRVKIDRNILSQALHFVGH